MRKIVPILVVLLLVPGIVLGANTTQTEGDVEDASPTLTIIQSGENFKVLNKEVIENENNYRIKGKIYFKYPPDCNKNAIRQVILGFDENQEAIDCIYNGIPGASAKEVNFDIKLSKQKIENMKEEYGEVNIIAAKHSGWRCSWSINHIWNEPEKEVKGIAVHTFSKEGLTQREANLSIVFSVILLSGITIAAYYLTKEKEYVKILRR